MGYLAYLPCPQSAWLAWMGVPMHMFQAALLHPYFQINHPKSTRLCRMIAIPICIYLALATIERRSFLPLDKYIHFNFGFVTMPTFHLICLSFIFGFHQGPVFKSEVELFNQNAQDQAEGRDEHHGADQQTEKGAHHPKPLASHSSNQSRNRKSKSKSSRGKKCNDTTEEKQKGSSPTDQTSITKNDPTKTSVDKTPPIGELARWVAALFMNPRGLICVWAPPENVVPIQKNLNPKYFVPNLLLRTAVMHFWFQFVCALGVEVVVNSNGDFDHFLFERIGLPPLRIIKLVSPFYMTVLLGGGAYSGFALAGGLFNILEISIISLLRVILPKNNSLRPDPLNPYNYPPLFNTPWLRTSLTEFWGKGWQAVFRHHFLFCGAQPMYKIFHIFGPTIGKLAAVMGAMGLSAAMHEFCLVAVSEIDPTFSSSRMFLGQGVGIALEAIFKLVTGHKVSGPLGWIWTFAFIIFNGRPMVDAWIQRGLGRGVLPIQEWGLIQHLVPFGPLITDEVYAWLMSWV
ncbi:hypothetical protein PSTG_14704 [Puccinia striiformis f. sp. tritici PST-78]|uniref:Wax synthase domain-containing protein n=1 Tax=Puccinia striiformis f. sp. tritici PST-78 TaxID=1165861 RepID=A0A0L0UXY9_9BASI|nr:hypothetical protein PSTG_14704 [Puccinia striiformis f. sp. tritici PST-78]